MKEVTFNVGDIVRINNKKAIYNNQIGKIIRIDRGSSRDNITGDTITETFCKILIDDDNATPIYSSDDLILESYENSNEKPINMEKTDVTGVIYSKENVDHPVHYSGPRECIDIMIDMFGEEAVRSFCRCNSFKYRFRANRKNGEEDIKKAEWYEQKLYELTHSDDPLTCRVNNW